MFQKTKPHPITGMRWSYPHPRYGETQCAKGPCTVRNQRQSAGEKTRKIINKRAKRKYCKRRFSPGNAHFRAYTTLLIIARTSPCNSRNSIIIESTSTAFTPCPRFSANHNFSKPATRPRSPVTCTRSFTA